MGIESAKMADIEMVDPLGCYFSFIQALLHWSKKMQKEYVHPCCQAVRLAFVTGRRRLPGPPHQRCCSDLLWIWRGINGEHWFRFQELSFELSRSHGHYSYKMLQILWRLGFNWILNDYRTLDGGRPASVSSPWVPESGVAASEDVSLSHRKRSGRKSKTNNL